MLSTFGIKTTFYQKIVKVKPVKKKIRCKSLGKNPTGSEPKPKLVSMIY